MARRRAQRPPPAGSCRRPHCGSGLCRAPQQGHCRRRDRWSGQLSFIETQQQTQWMPAAGGRSREPMAAAGHCSARRMQRVVLSGALHPQYCILPRGRARRGARGQAARPGPDGAPAGGMRASVTRGQSHALAPPPQRTHAAARSATLLQHHPPTHAIQALSRPRAPLARGPCEPRGCTVSVQRGSMPRPPGQGTTHHPRAAASATARAQR
jgi:hypothetical protein